jgi:methyl-accepting chemotaxis protein
LLVQEVAAASTEQSAGISQVTKAMDAVDQVTQRNAAAAEELSSTAEELASQAEALQQLMGFFQMRDAPEKTADLRPGLPDGEAGAEPAPAAGCRAYRSTAAAFERESRGVPSA